jgi:hypothetical protein
MKPVRLGRRASASLLFVALLFVAALSACRDIDELPPLPIQDPNAPLILDAGPDADDGAIT